MQDFSASLMSIGLSRQYVGHQYLVEAIEMVAENPDYLRYVTKGLYPEIAAKYHTTWSRVERSIRTAINVVWERNKRELEVLVRRELYVKPRPIEFIDMVSYYVVTQDVGTPTF